MSQPTGNLLSIQVGVVQRLVTPDDKRFDQKPAFWSSGIFKNPIAGPVHIRKTGLDGDQQADLENHGGPDNVILAYNADHYPHWREQLQRPDLAYGAFGENFTVRGFSDDTVCIADTWQVGDSVLLQITQARQPCFKLARRLQRPDIVRLVMESSRGGWYLRVLREGLVEAGMTIKLLERKYPEWTAAAAVQTMYARRTHPDPARRLAALPELSARWRRTFLESQ